MTEAPAPRQIPRTSAETAVVLRKIPYAIIALGFSVFGFTSFLASSQKSPLHAWPLFVIGAGGLIGAAVGASYKAEVRDGTLFYRGEWRRSRSVDLLQLVSASVPDQRVNRLTGFRPLILEDAGGSEVRISFYRTAPGTRRRLLAALEPYVRGPAVSRSGLIDRALAGELWLPLPRRAAAG